MKGDLFARVEDLGIEIELAPGAREFLVDKGFDPQFGARPLRRAIQKYVEDPMAESILSADLGEGDLITVDHKKGEEELFFKTKKAKKKPAPKKKPAAKKEEEEDTPAPDAADAPDETPEPESETES